jgi:hypothetical protein
MVRGGEARPSRRRRGGVSGEARSRRRGVQLGLAKGVGIN